MPQTPKKVAHPDWLDEPLQRYTTTYSLYKKGRLPESVEVFMLMTPLQWSMRSILGKSNIGCALWILKKELASKMMPILHPKIWWQTLRDAREYEESQ